MIKPAKLGLAFGIATAIFMFVYGILALFITAFQPGFGLITTAIPWVELSFIGVILVTVESFVETFIWIWLSFTFYNMIRGNPEQMKK